ncbi:MAG: L-serine ammonia-lyase, iron-sulfur-dependent, subunit alpha, partial [Oscillospiraceae bacterium]|nr:L-serine ammonia-lyase, iron-sulfur-dependent, subunit alpha [Oscillospiraceae bacterium]
MALDSIREILDEAQASDTSFWEVVLQADMEERQVTREASMAKMLTTWMAMQDAADAYTGTRKSVSGLVGG